MTAWQKPKRILLPLDGSERSLGTVRYIAKIKDFPYPGNSLKMPRLISHRIEEARNALLQSGFNENRIATKIITGVQSRAATLVKEARQENYDTIVLGRRGLSQIPTFFMRRVTNKVIHLAREPTVWEVR